MARCCSAFLDILPRFPNCDSSYLFRNRNSPKETEMLGVVKQFGMKLNGWQIHLSKNRTRVSGGLGCLCEPLTIIKPERPKGLLHLARIPMCIVFDDFQSHLLCAGGATIKAIQLGWLTLKGSEPLWFKAGEIIVDFTLIHFAQMFWKQKDPAISLDGVSILQLKSYERLCLVTFFLLLCST